MGNKPSIDCRIAKLVMGWKRCCVNEPYRYHQQAGGCIVRGVPQIFRRGLIPDDWFPFSNIADAFDVVEAMRKRGLRYVVRGNFIEGDGHWAAFDQQGVADNNPLWQGRGETPAEAICNAALACATNAMKDLR